MSLRGPGEADSLVQLDTLAHAVFFTRQAECPSFKRKVSLQALNGAVVTVLTGGVGDFTFILEMGV